MIKLHSVSLLFATICLIIYSDQSLAACIQTCDAARNCKIECPLNVLPVPVPGITRSGKTEITTNPADSRLNSCQYAFDGTCDEPTDCLRGTDTYDCKLR